MQLKFLQKSNEEQMGKLFDLWRYEPLAIHHHLTKTVRDSRPRTFRIRVLHQNDDDDGPGFVCRVAVAVYPPSSPRPRHTAVFSPRPHSYIAGVRGASDSFCC